MQPGERKESLRIPRTVCTTCVGAPFARLDMRSKLLLALAACTPDTLSGLAVDEVRAACLGRLSENNLLVRSIPVRNNWRVLGTLLENGGALLAAFFTLGLGPLRGETGALLA